MYKAFVFPGQGSQKVGMAKDFYDNYSVAKDVFKTVDNVLKYPLTEIIFDGTEEELANTIHTQPALMAVSVAIIRVMKEKSGKNIKDMCSFVAGHSLGEYSALCAAESISLEDAANLLKIRATSMQEAAPKGSGSMAACMGISSVELQKILDDAIDDGVCQIANDNVEGQIVISGHTDNIDRIVAILKDNSCKAIKLNVSAPFHSELVKDAQTPMKEALDKVEFMKPKVPIIANVSAAYTDDPFQIKQNLLKQISSKVRWRETMDQLFSLGATEIVEVGSGKVLSGLAKKSPNNFTISSINKIEDL